MGWSHRVGRVNYSGFLRQQGENPLGTRGRFLQHVVDRGQAQERLVDMRHIGDEDKQIGHGNAALQRISTPRPNHQHHPYPTGSLD